MTHPPFLLISPFLVQAIVISVDEFYFHRKRGLPGWELLSHPLDTLCLLGCFAFALTQSYNPMNIKIYIGLCVLSSLLVTKDEAVHRRVCSAAECWLHSILFLIHPVVLMDVAVLWKDSLDKSSVPQERTALLILISAAFLFLLYQITSALLTRRNFHESFERT